MYCKLSEGELVEDIADGERVNAACSCGLASSRSRPKCTGNAIEHNLSGIYEVFEHFHAYLHSCGRRLRCRRTGDPFLHGGKLGWDTRFLHAEKSA